MKNLSLFYVCLLSMHAQSFTVAEEQDPLQSDLRAITSEVKHYSVEDASLEEAVRELFRSAGEPQYAKSIRITGPEEARITINVGGVSVGKILGYIGELAGCYPCEALSWGSLVTDYDFPPIKVIDDRELMSRLVGFPLTKPGARRLGIHGDMTAHEVTAVLRGYGVVFDEEKEQIAMWNEETETMGVRAFTQAIEESRSIARLANEGFRLVKDEGQP